MRDFTRAMTLGLKPIHTSHALIFVLNIKWPHFYPSRKRKFHGSSAYTWRRVKYLALLNSVDLWEKKGERKTPNISLLHIFALFFIDFFIWIIFYIFLKHFFSNFKFLLIFFFWNIYVKLYNTFFNTKELEGKKRCGVILINRWGDFFFFF